MLSKGSGIFFIFFSLMVLGSFAITFYTKAVQKQFEIFTDDQTFSEALIEYFAE